MNSFKSGKSGLVINEDTSPINRPAKIRIYGIVLTCIIFPLIIIELILTVHNPYNLYIRYLGYLITFLIIIDLVFALYHLFTYGI